MKICVIGLDCCAPDVVFNDERLVNIRRLMDLGLYGRLESVVLRRSGRLPISAVFVFIGAEPGCSWLPDTVARDKLGYILTGIDALQSGRWPLSDREPCPLETTVPGILAAGDIRAGSTKRVGFAVGDGSLAVTCVHKLTAIRQ